MTESGLKIGGGTVFWSLAEWTELAALKENLGDAGFGDCVPSERPAASALRDALEATLGGPTVLVRPLKGGGGFLLVHERRGEEENDYTHSLRVRLDRLEDGTQRLLFAPYDDRAQRVLAAYNKYLGLLRAGQVAHCLVKVVNRLGATALRPSGGLYWIPDGGLTHWRQAVRAVEAAASEGRRHNLYTLTNVMDAEAVRAVRDAITAEITADSVRLYEEVFSGELGGKALATRKEEALILREKAALYEQLLEVGLNGAREALDRADGAIAAATLIESGQQEGAVA